ncbi:MAG: DNA primase, partial [Bdellovibrionales bacterium]|nr:DNA primase [Bdellovibrionales bacterium]
MSAPGSLQEVKDLVKDRADIVEIIGRYTKLIKIGPRYKGCCPFHKEKTPSFYVNPQEGFFHCFGCEAGGDIFSFLMKIEGLSFMEALKELAEALHIEIPKGAKAPTGEAYAAATSERMSGYEMLDRAAKFYNRVLLGETTPGARQALDYLLKRGITREEIEELLLGFSPESGAELAKKITTPTDRDLADKVGLLRKGREGYYEFFRSRMVIPIRDAKGRVCAFSGRTLGEVTGQNPKYKNSAETDWFKKKEILYGLERAAKLIREEDFVCLVEGYFDQWAFHRHGVPAVAVMGTALSEEHLKLLGRYTKRVVLVLDADRAGIESTLKVIPMLLRESWDVKVFSELEGKDPDEWLAQGSAASAGDVKRRLLTAPEALEWWSKQVLKDSLAASLGRLEIFKRLAQPWNYTQTKAHKSLIADEIGRSLGLPPRTVWESLEDLVKDRPVPAPVKPEASFADESKASFSASNLSLRSAAEEIFSYWIRFWDVLTPFDAEAWAEREALFARTPAEPVVRKLRQSLESGEFSVGSGPKEWLSHLDENSILRPWLLKGVVLTDSPEGRLPSDKILISFN